MDFGAMVCKPVPLCKSCPFNKVCKAFLENKIFDLPVKLKRPAIQKRWFNYIILEHKEKIAIRQRTEKDIWHNLFEFLLVETGALLDQRGILRQAEKSNWIEKNSFELVYQSPVFRQQLSHQRIEGRFTRLKLKQRPLSIRNILWVGKNEIKSYPFPRIINEYMQIK
jgi:A/G-specific adenine glycosylase